MRMIVLLACVAYATASRYNDGQSYSTYSRNVYQGSYQGSCDNDGFYYMDDSSFMICSNGNAYRQPCAPGSRNSNSNRFQSGGQYSYSDFCDVNLVDQGYTLYHRDNRYQNSYQPQPTYPQPSYPQPSYPQPSYPQPSYPQPSYPQPSYPQPSYPQPTYPQPSYPQPSYDSYQSSPQPNYRRESGYGDSPHGNNNNNKGRGYSETRTQTRSYDNNRGNNPHGNRYPSH